MKKRIEAHVRWLEKELTRADRDLEEAIEESPAWRENEALLRGVPGVGPVLARTRYWPSCLSLARLIRTSSWPLSWVSLP